MKKIRVSKNRLAVTILAGIVLVLFFATVAGLVFYRDMIRRLGEVQEEVYTEYPRLYAYIAEDPDSQLSKRIYKEITEYAQQNGCYVEMTGQNLTKNYSKADRINIAISSKVDGIILEGDNSAETSTMKKKAIENNIPVVTVLSDCEESSRTSFVNLNNVDLGKEYGRQLAKLRGEKPTASTLNAVILLDTDTRNSDDTIYRSIMAFMAGGTVSLSSYTVDTSTPFATQEKIMKKLDELDKQNNIPDVIVCLNDRTTESTIQCIVEKNLVGKTKILGYYDSETILKAIEKGSVSVTFTVEADTIAKQCINLLNEYNDTGLPSNYATAGYIKIDRTNVAKYYPEEDKNEG